MSSKRIWVAELIMNVVRCDAPTAEMLMERLMEEGLLHLGYGDAEIDMVVDTFTDTFGTTKVTKNDRFAANRLVRKYGAQSVVGIIRLLGSNSTAKYAPVVGSITQLEDKWVSVLAFLRKQGTNEEIIV